MSNESRPEGAAPRRPVVIERSYRAPVAALWEVWTTKHGFESWWGPEGFRTEVYTLEARVGGTLHYAIVAEAPEQIEIMARMGRPISHAAFARFTELTPRRRLALTNLIDFLPGVEPYENTILAEFVPAGDSMRMAVTLDPLHDDAFTRMSIMGFTSQLTKLDGHFGAPSR